MKKITEIYQEYNIMPILAIHQIRVASVALIICDNLKLKIDKDAVVKACLFHDIANIIKFNLDYFPEYNKPQGRDYWQGIKDEYISKYGDDEHKASVEIVKNIGLSEYIVHLVDTIDSGFIEKARNTNDFAEKICIYADNRVTPHGIVSIEERSLEAKKRYENHPHSFGEDERNFFMDNLREVEKQIFSECSIGPSDVNDENIKIYIEELKDILV